MKNTIYSEFDKYTSDADIKTLFQKHGLNPNTYTDENIFEMIVSANRIELKGYGDNAEINPIVY